MTKYLKWIVIVIILTLVIYNLICFYALVTHDFDNDLNKLNLKEIDSLMIVAHPDDETLWGGAHLNEGNYLIVCITCGKSRIRYHEIQSVSQMSNNSFIGLYYPDKTVFVRNNWKNYEDAITDDITKIVKLKNWKIIVTHNKYGEYGHIHHIKTHRIVTNIYENLKLQDKTKLYYFGDYYPESKAKYLKSSTYFMNDDMLRKKELMIKKYRSQYFVTKKFKHMKKYENFVEYSKETK